MREELSELEHIQWEHWSKTLSRELKQILYAIEQNKIKKSLVLIRDRIYRWELNWKPYSELSEETKEFDREWADKIGKIIEIKGRKAILRLRHDPGSPKGATWCDGYHEGLADMLGELEKEFEGKVLP